MSGSDYYSDDECELFGYDEVSETSVDTGSLKYRSIAVESRHTSAFSADVVIGKAFVEQKASSASFRSGCPSAPYGMAKNYVTMVRPTFTAVRQAVDEFLTNQADYDFLYFEDEYMWKGRYLCGSSSFDLEINLYHDKITDAYTVAVRKISCDCSVNGCFNTFFGAMKTALCNDSSACSAPARKVFCIPKCGGFTVTDEEFLEGVQPIFKMAACSIEARVQSVKMLCDVAQKDARYLELPAFRGPCLQLLESLVQDESDEVRQHAVMAVAALVELNSYREAFLHSSMLVALFCLVENCQYETAQMRRTAARVLAVLCRTQPYSVRSELQQQCFFDLAGWLQRASCLQDARTREAALTVKAFLEDVSMPSGEMKLTGPSEGLECIFVNH